MKVELKETKKEQSREYPYIGRHPQSKVVVLFIEKDSGVVLLGGADLGYRIGRTYLDWHEVAFDIFEGEIVLSND